MRSVLSVGRIIIKSQPVAGKAKSLLRGHSQHAVVDK